VMQPVNMTYTSANQLATNNNKPVIYDADGNMTQERVNYGVQNYSFDSRNRLLKQDFVSDVNLGTLSGSKYTYDAENNRIKIEYALEYYDFVVNSESPLSQILMRILKPAMIPGDQSFKEYYVHGLGLIGHEYEGTYYNYHFDLRGSTIALTNQQGEIVDRYQYGPYGELAKHTGTSITPFWYNGRDGVMLDATGYYMRARYYNTAMKRFINQDVLRGNIRNGQSLNRYAYVNGNPVSYVDPLGYSRSKHFKIALYETYKAIISGVSGFGKEFAAGGSIARGRIKTSASLALGGLSDFNDSSKSVNVAIAGIWNGIVGSESISYENQRRTGVFSPIVDNRYLKEIFIGNQIYTDIVTFKGPNSRNLRTPEGAIDEARLLVYRTVTTVDSSISKMAGVNTMQDTLFYSYANSEDGKNNSSESNNPICTGK